MPQAQHLLSEAEQANIVSAIKLAEQGTTGEIRVHIDNYCNQAPLDKAAEVFNKLQMDKTKERNGVLIYVAAIDRRFAIWGDEGIHEKIDPKSFWAETLAFLHQEFLQQNFEAGLIKAIERVGGKLKTLYPGVKENPNELEDDISFGN